ncbi:AAA family ATPase [Acinetobacter baumannii]|uniref:AAA family ATPase n=1 Tax=Acinetobacter baumannii TaxID=470 RepID=UPI0012451091|nr:AAA family ATPase [Acinetobacter baumannii]KAB0455047.1 AAA family ATPase [Acinetobacter baumannii]MDC5166024.1 AAA family ATPase [Acinetobacter baumannii]
MINYYLRAFHAENFRQFSKISMTFGKNFNFITGPNGCGKSGILTGIHHCLSYDWSSSRLNNNTSFYVQIEMEDKIIFSGLGKNSFNSRNTYRQNSLDNWTTPEVDVSGVDKNYSIITPNNNEIMPLFLGTKRSIDYQRIEGARREEDVQQSVQKYRNHSLESNSSNVKQWFINRYFFIDKEWAVEEKLNWNVLMENLPKLAPFDSDFKYIRTERDLEPIFSLYGQECYLEELSAGFQAIFSIIANIIEWIEATNPIGHKDIQKAVGTVLIDELDLHLHPEWQFSIRDGLEAIFQNLQFIVTTHSPHLLSSAKEGEVIVMTRTNGVMEYEFTPSSKRYSGWNTDQILEDVMGVKSLNNKDYEQLVNQALDAYEQRNKAELIGLIQRLKDIAHSNDTIVQVLEIRLASLELVND